MAYRGGIPAWGSGEALRAAVRGDGAAGVVALCDIKEGTQVVVLGAQSVPAQRWAIERSCVRTCRCCVCVCVWCVAIHLQHWVDPAQGAQASVHARIVEQAEHTGGRGRRGTGATNLCAATSFAIIELCNPPAHKQQERQQQQHSNRTSKVVPFKKMSKLVAMALMSG